MLCLQPMRIHNILRLNVKFFRNIEQLVCQHCKKTYRMIGIQYIIPQWVSIKNTDLNKLLLPYFSFPKAHQQTIKPGFPAIIIHSGFFRLRRPRTWNSDIQDALTVITALHFPNGWLQSPHIPHRRFTIGCGQCPVGINWKPSQMMNFVVLTVCYNVLPHSGLKAEQVIEL